MRVYEKSAYELIGLYNNPPHCRTRNSPLYRQTMAKIEAMLSDFGFLFQRHSPVVGEVATLLTANLHRFTGSERVKLEQAILKLRCFIPSKPQSYPTLPICSILYSNIEIDDDLSQDGYAREEEEGDDAGWPLAEPLGGPEPATLVQGPPASYTFELETRRLQENSLLPLDMQNLVKRMRIRARREERFSIERKFLKIHPPQATRVQEAPLPPSPLYFNTTDDGGMFTEFDPRFRYPDMPDDEWKNDDVNSDDASSWRQDTSSDSVSEMECASPFRDVDPVVYEYV